jgi:hypothetical protein
VHALDKGLITPVAQRLAFGAQQDSARPSRARHQWVLTRRLHECDDTIPELDDLERVYHALWVAVVASEEAEVPTRAVTAVLRNVEDLALRTERNTLNHLTTLHTRNLRLAEKVQRPGVRWTMWRPIGEVPDHPMFEHWVRAVRATDAIESHVPGAGHATLNAMAHELVVLALRATRSSHWPAGHSVQIADIRAIAGRDPRARQLARAIRERGRSLGSVLGDLTKEKIAGRARVERPVVRITSPDGWTYYDAPAEPGLERRQQCVTYRALQRELSAARMDALMAEYVAADALFRGGRSDTLRAIGAVRRVLVHQGLDTAERLMAELEAAMVLLSKAVRTSVAEHRGKLDRVRDRIGQLVFEIQRERIELAVVQARDLRRAGHQHVLGYAREVPVERAFEVLH